MSGCKTTFWGRVLHDWTEWKMFEQPIITKYGKGVELRQRRTCKNCGYVDEEIVW
jgi:hypothetical protein